MNELDFYTSVIMGNMLNQKVLSDFNGISQLSMCLENQDTRIANQSERIYRIEARQGRVEVLLNLTDQEQ